MYRIDALGAPSGDGTLDDPNFRGMHAVYQVEEIDGEPRYTLRPGGRLAGPDDKVVSVWHRWAPPGEPAGELLFASQYNDDGGLGWNARLYLRGFEPGVYFVEVSGVSSGGTYQLTMTEVEDDDPGIRSLTVGGSVSGELDFARDEDVSQVELAAGTEYEVRLKATGWHNTSFERPELAQVLDVTDSGDPTEVTCETDHRRESCVFTASESGAYRITVHGVVHGSTSGRHFAVGPYELTVTVTAR